MRLRETAKMARRDLFEIRNGQSGAPSMDCLGGQYWLLRGRLGEAANVSLVSEAYGQAKWSPSKAVTIELQASDLHNAVLFSN